MVLRGRQAHTVAVLTVRRGCWQQHRADGNIHTCNAQVRRGLGSSRLHTAQKGTKLRVSLNSNNHGAFGAASSQASQVCLVLEDVECRSTPAVRSRVRPCLALENSGIVLDRPSIFTLAVGPWSFNNPTPATHICTSVTQRVSAQSLRYSRLLVPLVRRPATTKSRDCVA